MKVTEKDIREANEAGLNDSFVCYYTAVLTAAYNLGLNGHSLVGQSIATGYRYGNAPESLLSRNYRDDKTEAGLSMAALVGEAECSSCIFFSDRAKVYYTGIISPVTGSDDETLLLVIGGENLDN
jgi:hypothetical protein